ncbi:hypothetical protein Chor_002029 [Crotalus horridus]
MPAGKTFRRRKADSEEEEEDELVAEEVRAAALLVGEKLQEETTLVDDPFKIKSGGMVDMKKLKERGKERISEEEDLNLGTSFSAETNRRDEDADIRNKEEPKARPLRVGDTEKTEMEKSPPNRKRPPNEKATDDYHYEKFKKMNRRY